MLHNVGATFKGMVATRNDATLTSATLTSATLTSATLTSATATIQAVADRANGYSDDRCTRSPEAWRIEGKRLVALWSTGDRSVMDIARARAGGDPRRPRIAD